jgi:NADPH2:quinone reductase
MMSGKYQVRPALPFVPGSEIAGVVTEVAPDVRHIRVGARVAGLNYTFTGGLAEAAVIPAAIVAEVPATIPLEAAATMLVNYSTAYYALKDRGNLQPGETVLVLGAGGGVGLAAIEIAKTLGARVLAAASSEHKRDLAHRHGADDSFDYSRSPIKEALKERGGVDVVVDPVGGEYSEQALRSLRPGGRLLVVGFAAGEIPRIPLNLPLLKNCSITGVFLGAQTRDEPACFVANMHALFALYEEQRLRPVITELQCFEGYAGALERIADRNAVGKVVMRLAGAETVEQRLFSIADGLAATARSTEAAAPAASPMRSPYRKYGGERRNATLRHLLKKRF